MQKKRSNFAHKAWNILRLALLWARKGGASKRSLITDLRPLSKFLKNLGQSTKQSIIHYGDHELSFENTPIIHIKIHRPSLINFWMPCVPCINPKDDLGLDDDKHNHGDAMSSYWNDRPRKNILLGGNDDDDDDGCEVCEEISSPCDKGIDQRADQFIAKFYDELKRQRQISCVQYDDMLN